GRSREERRRRDVRGRSGRGLPSAAAALLGRRGGQDGQARDREQPRAPHDRAPRRRSPRPYVPGPPHPTPRPTPLTPSPPAALTAPKHPATSTIRGPRGPAQTG